jgi:hypothetical protein
MASRSSTSVGAGVAIALLSILTLTGLVLSIVFYGNYKKATEQIAQMESEYREVINAGEKNRAAVQRLLDEAGRERSSLVMYLTDQLSQSMQLTTGSDSSTFADLQSAVREAVGGDTATPLVRLVRMQQQRLSEAELTISDLQDQLAETEFALDDQTDRLAEIDALRRDEVGEQQRLVDSYASNVDEYGSQLRSTITTVEQRVDEVTSQYEAELASLRADYDAAQSENLVLKTQIANLRAESRDSIIKPRTEYALVDAEIIGTNSANQTAIINRGRQHNIVLGMSFDVYSNATLIEDPETGQMLPGKGTLEVINVEDQTATARIIRSNVGDPVLEGDLCANAAYDPNKKYRFLVYGDFDTNFDGQNTGREADDIKALLEQWGGVVVESIEDNIDFLVLGSKPVVGPAPPPGSPLALIRDWQRRKRLATDYDELFATATATSIPVLNQNRLSTLIGYFER